MRTTAPSTVGMWRISPGAFFNSSSFIGVSVAPKSTVCSVNLLDAAARPDGLVVDLRFGLALPYSLNHF